MTEQITSVGQLLSKGTQFPPVGQKRQAAKDVPLRLDVMARNKLLWENGHDLVYDDWAKLLRQDEGVIIELLVNFQRRLTVLWVSLMLTEPPKFIAKDKAAQDFLDQLVRDNRLVTGIQSNVIDQSRYGTGLYKATYRANPGRVSIMAQPPYMEGGAWFPIVDPMNVQDVVAHVLAFTVTTRETVLGFPVKRTRLYAEIHERGQLTTQTWLMDGKKLAVLEDEKTTPTGVDDFLVVPAHNLLTSDAAWGVDDYTDIDSLLHEIELRLSQLSRVLDKHAEPNLQGPPQLIQGNQGPQGPEPATLGRQVANQAAGVKTGGRYFARVQGDPAVEYVTWDPNVEAMKLELDTLKEWLYVLSETSEAAFGQLKAGLAESGSALRRLLMAPLLKTTRLRNSQDEALRAIIKTASQLAVAQGVPNAVVIEDVEIEWRDGLPHDMTEAANVEATMFVAGLSSKESSIQRVYGLEGDALKAEMARIDAKDKAKKEAEAVQPPVVIAPQPTGDKPAAE